MVGVAGKSKACHNCKARRVKCDLGRPRCARCAKAGLTCLGYQLKQIFVNRTHINPSVTARDVIASTNRAPSPEEHGTVDVVLEYRNLVRMLESTAYTTTEFRSGAYRILRRLYLPEERFVDASISIGQHSWVVSVSRMSQESLVLDHSLLAFCAAQLYATHHGGITLYGALDLYNKGLSGLSHALQQVDTTSLVTVVGSIVVLATCELFLYPSNTGWVAHVHGIAKILRLQDDFSHLMCSSQDWARLTARTRVLSVLIDLMRPHSGRLTASQWREVMFAKVDNDPFDNLLDVVWNLPEIFERATTSAESVVEIIQILHRMRTWEENFQMSDKASPLTFIDSQMHNPADEHYQAKLFPTVLEFQSLSAASCLLVCWGVRLQALSVCIQLCESPSLEPGNTSTSDAVWNFLGKSASEDVSPADALKAEANRWARLLCQCIEYTHRIEMGTVGPQSMTYGKWVLRNYFQRAGMTRELNWCENISNMTSNDGTHRVLRLMDFQAPDVLSLENNL